MKPQLLCQNNVYSEFGMQVYVYEMVKKPVLDAFDMLFDSSSSVAKKVKAGMMLLKAFEALKGVPEPTKENTWHPNSHNLIDLRDWLLPKINLSRERMGFIRRVINFAIVIIDFDPPWRWIFDKAREKAMTMEWKPSGWNDTWVPYAWWKE